jgi:hypothetical protein
MSTAALMLEERPPVSQAGDVSAFNSPNAILARLDLIDFDTGCKALDVSPRTMERRIAEGLPVILLGGKRFFSPSSLKTYLMTLECQRRQPVRRGRPANRRAA